MVHTFIFGSLLSLIVCAQNSWAEKSWTFVFAEDQQWQAHTIALDQDGWPRVKDKKYFAEQAAATAFSAQVHAVNKPPVNDVVLKNENGFTLWTVTNQWSWDWEIKFSEWVKNELNAQWWKQHGIATDCADVVYSARWIFARNNGLPMANHLITGHIFTHESVKPAWESLATAPEWQNDQRFLAALDYLLSQAFTHSLWRDSYPVAVNPRSIIPGGYHLYIDQKTGHTQFIYQVGKLPADLPLVTLNSTVPRELRDMMEWVFFEQTADPSNRALVRMRWPEFANGTVTFTPPRLMPNFSQEQFAANFIGEDRGTFWREVYYRLNPRANFDLIAQKTAQQIIEQFKARAPVVENGYRECSLSPCKPGTLRYDAWSTPSRDHRIAETIVIFDSLSSMINSWTAIRQTLYTPVARIEGSSYSGADFITKWRSQSYSSDPNESPRARWGLGFFE